MSRDLPVPQHSLDQYMLEVGRVPLLSRAEERALAEQLHGEDRDAAREAARRLVASNLRFVVKVAFEFKNYNIRMTDVIQEGNIGLMHAVSKFEPDRGYRLVSYAVWWIKAYIQNFIIKNWSLVPVASRRKMLFGKRHKLPTGEIVTDGDDDEEAEGGRRGGERHFVITAEPTEGREYGVTNRELMLARRDFSLDTTVGSDAGATTTHLMRLPSGGPSAEEDLGREQVRAQVNQAVSEVLERLGDRDRYILQHRLLTDEPESLQTIGDRYGISRERARQLEQRIKDKLKKALTHLRAEDIVVEE